MTQESEDAAIGRMVAQLSELKRRRVALIGEAQELGRQLDDAGKSLRGLDYTRAFSDGRPSTSMNRDDVKPPIYQPAERAHALLDELREVARELRATRERLKSAGLDVD